MTKKHFIALARILAQSRPDVEDFRAFETWITVRARLTEYLHSTNDLFDEDRFILATEDIYD